MRSRTDAQITLAVMHPTPRLFRALLVASVVVALMEF